MNKLEFINALGERLSVLPPQEASGVLDYYVESIDDRMEDGMTEEAAIASLGPIDDLAAKILSEQEALQPAAPKAPSVPEAPKKRRFSPGIIVLLVLGSPIWLSLAVAALAVALSLYAVVWVLLAVLLVVSGAMILSGILGGVISFLASVTPNTLAMRILCCGVSLVCAGLGFLLLPASLWLIRWFVRLHQLAYHRLKSRKEASK